MSAVASPSTSSPARAGALVFAALNLRLAIAAVPPVLAAVRHSTGLSSAGGGLLTAIPVFCFGACALAAPRLIRRLDMGPLFALVLLTVIAGIALRLLDPLAALLVGTALLGAAIAVGNVIVPALIKRDFAAQRVGMTALYSVALFVGGGLSAGLTVPLTHLTGWGWRPVIALWGIFAIAGLVLWLPRARVRGGGLPDRGGAHEDGDDPDGGGPLGAGRSPSRSGELAPVEGLWRDPLAWCVTAFMGLQSLGYYALLSWIPTLLEDHGVSSGTAGWLLSYSTLPGMLAALATPLLERRLAHPRGLPVLAVVLCAGGYVGLLLAPAHATYAWMTLLGLGQGVALSLALGYITARAVDGHQAAHLSTMAQSVGYMVAAGGPFLMGALHGATGTWTLPLVVLLVLLIPLLGAGLVAARSGYVLGGGGATTMPPAGIEPASRA